MLSFIIQPTFREIKNRMNFGRVYNVEFGIWLTMILFLKFRKMRSFIEVVNITRPGLPHGQEKLRKMTKVR